MANYTDVMKKAYGWMNPASLVQSKAPKATWNPFDAGSATAHAEQLAQGTPEVIGNTVNTQINQFASTLGIPLSVIYSAFSGNSVPMVDALTSKGLSAVEAQSLVDQFNNWRLSENTPGKVEAGKGVISTAQSYADKIKNYKTPEQQAAETQTADDAAKAEQNTLLQQNTARKMALLNQALQGQRAQGQAAIRAQLAQRNMLNSGSLQGSMAKNDRYFGELAARGGLEAGIQETGGLMDWLRNQQQQKWNERMQEKGWNQQLQNTMLGNLYNQQGMNQQRSWQLQDRDYNEGQAKRDREYQLWGNILGGVGTVVGAYAGRPVTNYY